MTLLTELHHDIKDQDLTRDHAKRGTHKNCATWSFQAYCSPQRRLRVRSNTARGRRARCKATHGVSL
jgi:hypothetical protein